MQTEIGKDTLLALGVGLVVVMVMATAGCVCCCGTPKSMRETIALLHWFCWAVGRLAGSAIKVDCCVTERDVS